MKVQIQGKQLKVTDELRSYVRLFLNDEDVRFLGGKKTALKPGDTVAIVPAIAGGLRRPATCAACR